MSDADILLITHNRPAYVALSLPRLLETCPDGSRVWVWHNGQNADVLAEIDRHRGHPRLHRYFHSEENVGLRPAVNWLWNNAEGRFVSKVDDDSLMEPGWIQRLTNCLEQWERFGVLGTWRFEDEDFDEALAAPKIQEVHGVRLLRNHWVQGSGHMLRRELVKEFGPLGPTQSFTSWCLDVARSGYVNGWPMPFVREEHMDDPRHPSTMFVDDEAFRAYRPLSAVATGVETLGEWADQMKASARVVQGASLDMRQYFGWRPKARNARRRLRSVLTGRAPWEA
jgi:glycosyltransferase involved in cell wall biosynthesis